MNNCEICQSPMSEPVAGLFALPTVTSDCRPWSNGRSVQICSGCGVMKRITNKTFNQAVYKAYTSYPEPSGRTAKILNFVKAKLPVPHRVLDIGCGQGEGLRILQDYFTDAKVFGYEPTIDIERPTGKFDLITLFHVFEHVEDLHEMLAYIKLSLADNGHVLIQVPYTAMWSFDLVIADHAWHFTKKSLKALLMKNGFSPVFITNEVIRKEITVLAEVNDKFEMIVNESSEYKEEYLLAVDWILRWKKHLDSINESVAVYGTSVSAMWTGNILGDKVVCYIDDDLERRGKFNDRQALSAFDCELPVVAPFPDCQIEEIMAKHPTLKFL